MTLTHVATPILEHSDSDFDAGSKRKLASQGRKRNHSIRICDVTLALPSVVE